MMMNSLPFVLEFCPLGGRDGHEYKGLYGQGMDVFKPVSSDVERDFAFLIKIDSTRY
jgi:hypothetical protein